MTGNYFLDLETREYFERNIEELRKRPILNINRVKDAPIDWPFLMAVPQTFFDKYGLWDVQLVGDRSDWNKSLTHVNGKAKYYRMIVRWRDGVFAPDRDYDEIEATYEHQDETFVERWYDEAMGTVEPPMGPYQQQAPVNTQPFDYKKGITAIYRGDSGDAVKAAQSQETWQQHMSSPLWQRVTVES